MYPLLVRKGNIYSQNSNFYNSNKNHLIKIVYNISS
jgi:hypothetical protein